MMSFWGGTVIINLLSLLPNIVEVAQGGFYVADATLKRFFVFHMLAAFISLLMAVIHFLLLHVQSSTSPLDFNANNYNITLHEPLVIKDLYSLSINWFLFLISPNLLVSFFFTISLIKEFFAKLNFCLSLN